MNHKHYDTNKITVRTNVQPYHFENNISCYNKLINQKEPPINKYNSL